MTRTDLTIGVLALQGAFVEHVECLKKALNDSEVKEILASKGVTAVEVTEVRTEAQLAKCNGLVIPGGESTTISLVAERTGILEPLRKFVKFERKPTWGTCAGMILLAEEADRVKRGGQELIGGLDVRVERNHFGRQTESFSQPLDLKFLSEPFPAVFIRAPIVQSVLSHAVTADMNDEKNVVAPSIAPKDSSYKVGQVEILGKKDDKIVAVRQGNVFGISFHPELTHDIRVHKWWIQNCVLPTI